MAVIKQRLKRFNGSSYDTVHLETESACITDMPDMSQVMMKSDFSSGMAMYSTNGYPLAVSAAGGTIDGTFTTVGEIERYYYEYSGDKDVTYFNEVVDKYADQGSMAITFNGTFELPPLTLAEYVPSKSLNFTVTIPNDGIVVKVGKSTYYGGSWYTKALTAALSNNYKTRPSGTSLSVGTNGYMAFSIFAKDNKGQYISYTNTPFSAVVITWKTSAFDLETGTFTFTLRCACFIGEYRHNNVEDYGYYSNATVTITGSSITYSEPGTISAWA